MLPKALEGRKKERDLWSVSSGRKWRAPFPEQAWDPTRNYLQGPPTLPRFEIKKHKGETKGESAAENHSGFSGGFLPPTISRGGCLHHTCLLSWHWSSCTADQKIKLGASAGIGANFVMLVKINLSRVHHFPVHRETRSTNSACTSARGTNRDKILLSPLWRLVKLGNTRRSH